MVKHLLTVADSTCQFELLLSYQLGPSVFRKPYTILAASLRGAYKRMPVRAAAVSDGALLPRRSASDSLIR